MINLNLITKELELEKGRVRVREGLRGKERIIRNLARNIACDRNV